MSKVIASALLVIAGVIGAVALTSSFLPAVNRGASSILISSAALAERTKTGASIVFAVADNTNSDIVFWAKNVGAVEIKAIGRSDLFVTTPTGAKFVPFDADCVNQAPDCWSFALEGGATIWDRASSIKVTVSLAALPNGEYGIDLVLPNGVSAEATLSA